jgi:hypothetical protein
MNTQTKASQEERVLLKKDTSREAEMKRAVSAFQPCIDEVMKSFQALNLGEPNLDILAKHRKNFETYIKQLLYNANPTMKALPIDRDQAIGMMQLPEAYWAFASAMEDYNLVLTEYAYDSALGQNAKYWAMDPDGDYVPSVAYYQHVEDSTCKYASPKQVEFMQKAEAVVRALNELKALTSQSGIDLITPTNSRGYLIDTGYWSSDPITVNKEVILSIR